MHTIVSSVIVSFFFSFFLHSVCVDVSCLHFVNSVACPLLLILFTEIFALSFKCTVCLLAI